MKLIYIHRTPLAAIAALSKTKNSISLLEPYIYRREHFLKAGNDAEGNEVYALWLNTDMLLTRRLIMSYCELHNISDDTYIVKDVRPGNFRTKLIAFLFYLGLPRIALALLKLCANRNLADPLPGLTGID
ncbi:MAG: hypothetical protein H0Z39_01985 [Peptococcaceae bacterium]|nr:hypothetical protein [Peptococcaceae bacterium]